MRQGSPSHWLFVSSTACSVLALAACGGSEEQPEPSARPALAAEVSEFLVTETEEVTEALEAGDLQVARDEALELRQLVEERIAAGKVPRLLQQPLRDAANRLVESIEVPAAPPPPPPPPEEEPAEEEGCEELAELQATLEGERDALDKKDPNRKAIEEQLKTVKGQLNECEKGGGEDGEQDDGGDDD